MQIYLIHLLFMIHSLTPIKGNKPVQKNLKCIQAKKYMIQWFLLSSGFIGKKGCKYKLIICGSLNSVRAINFYAK